jgi:transposase
LSDFEREQIVGARLAVASVTKTTTVSGVSRATVYKVMSAYTNHGKTTSAEWNSGRKSTLTEKYRCTLRWTVSKNHRTTAAQLRAELNIHLEDLFPQKLSDVIFTNPTSTAGLQLLNL